MTGGAILIIDDDMDYSCLVQVAFLEAPVSNPILLMNDGFAALSYLKRFAGKGKLKTTDLPALVVLDLRMPKFSGLEVLRGCRSESHLAKVPIVVFTGLEAGDEPAQALALGASSLYLKPSSYRELVQTARILRDEYLGYREFEEAA